MNYKVKEKMGGAASCNPVCVGAKYKRPSMQNPIKVKSRPGIHDLSSSMDNYDDHIETANLLA